MLKRYLVATMGTKNLVVDKTIVYYCILCIMVRSTSIRVNSILVVESLLCSLSD